MRAICVAPCSGLSLRTVSSDHLSRSEMCGSGTGHAGAMQDRTAGQPKSPGASTGTEMDSQHRNLDHLLIKYAGMTEAD